MQVLPDPRLYVYDLKSLMHIASYIEFQRILKEEFGIEDFGVRRVGSRSLPVVEFRTPEDRTAFALKYDHIYGPRQWN